MHSIECLVEAYGALLCLNALTVLLWRGHAVGLQIYIKPKPFAHTATDKPASFTSCKNILTRTCHPASASLKLAVSKKQIRDPMRLMRGRGQLKRSPEKSTSVQRQEQEKEAAD